MEEMTQLLASSPVLLKMIRIGQSVREFSFEEGKSDDFESDPFFIDVECQFKFCVSLQKRGYYLRSKCINCATMELEYDLWLKNSYKGAILNRIFGSGCWSHGYGRAMNVEMRKPYVKDGIITVCVQIVKAYIIVQSKNDFSLFSRKDELCDISVRVGEKVFPASKYVLGIQSDVFAAMWKHNMIESEKNEVLIKDFDAETVEQMLNFVHSFGYEVPKNGFKDLYLIADKYQIFPLKIKCILKLIESVSDENFCDLLVFAATYNVNELEKVAVEYAQKDGNMLKFLNSDEFEEINSNSLTKELVRKIHKRKCTFT